MARIDNDITETIVVIAPSLSERYLSTWLFADVNVESDLVVHEPVAA
jgi:hypothetical protein